MNAVAHLLLVQSAQLTAVVAAVALIATTALRRRPHLAYALWLAALAKCFVPPVWSSPTGLFSWAAAAAHVTPSPAPADPLAVDAVSREPAIRPTPNVPRPAAATERPAVSPVVTTPIDWAAVTVVCWLSGTAAVLLATAVASARLHRQLRRTDVPVPPALAAAVAAVAARLGVRRPPPVRVTTADVGPALVGTVRPTIVLPAALLAAPAGQWTAVLAHELAHHRRGDAIVAAVQRLAVAVWWFHPLMWLMSARLTAAREQCCDESAVAAASLDPADYAQALLDVVRRRRRLTPLIGVSAMAMTRARLTHLTGARRFHRRTPWTAWAAAAVAAALVVPGGSLVRLPTVVASDPPSPPSPPSTRLGGRPLVFHGSLADARQGWPIVGATVTVTLTRDGTDAKLTRTSTTRNLLGPTTSRTGDDGRYEVVIPAELAGDLNLSVQVSATHPEYGHRMIAARWLRGFVDDVAWVKAHAPTRDTLPYLTAQWEPADEVVGTLVRPDGSPAAHVPIRAASVLRQPSLSMSDATDTDAAGRFSFRAFTFGQTSLWAEPADAAAMRMDVTGQAADRRLDLGRVTLPPGSPIAGRVTGDGGKPLADVAVSAYAVEISRNDAANLYLRPLRAVRTDADGRFTLPPVPAGKTRVQVNVADPDPVHAFPDGMGVPVEYMTASTGVYPPTLVDVPADGRPVPPLKVKPTPRVRVVVRAVDPQGHPADAEDTFVLGTVNGVSAAWLARATGADTVETLIPAGATHVTVGLNTLTGDDRKTVARYRRGTGPEREAAYADLGSVTADVTDLFAIRYPRPELSITVTDEQGHPLPAARAGLRYAKPDNDSPYRDRILRGPGSPQPWRSTGVWPNQPFTLTVSAAGYADQTRDLTLGWGEQRTVAVQLSPAPATRPAGGG